MSALLDRLPTLQERFLAGLDRRLDEIAAMMEGARDQDALMRMFHSIAGIAGTYGYPHITEISRRGELLCSAAIEEGRAITELEERILSHALVAMRAASSAAR